MNTRPGLRGIDLRYALTTYLFQHGPAAVADLIDGLNRQGFTIAGRASKSVSDALRREIQRGRVRRYARALYGPGWMPRAGFTSACSPCERYPRIT